MLPVGIERYLALYPQCCHMGEEIILTDLTAFDMPAEVRHTTCIVLALCTGGKARYSAMGMDYEVSANDVIIIGEGKVLGDIQHTEDFSGYLIFVSRKLLEGVMGDLHKVSNMFVFAHENPVLRVGEHSAMMLSKYLKILQLVMEDETHAYRQQEVAAILTGIVYEAANASSLSHAQEATARTRAEYVFKQYISLVEEHFRYIRRVGWYSEQMDITPKTLLEIVKRVSNRTPNEWLDIYAINELRQLVRHTDLSMKEISERLNFSNQAAMGKFFKEHVGVSPSRYRQNG